MRYAEAKKSTRWDEGRAGVSQRTRRTPIGQTEEVRIVHVPKEDLAWEAFAGMVHAHMVWVDDEAQAHGGRLLRLYLDITKAEYAQASARFSGD